ncbi:MAG: replication factor C large subunit [Candidatus Nanoarchaeia archaeon]|nr:replication factor C large subunit [Candidatus Nanoarchaeia archaeon]
MNLAEKYFPQSGNEIIGHDSHVALLRKFFSEYKSMPHKAILLVGSTGSGKTSIVHAIAKELVYDVIEFSASDNRSKKNISSLIKEASKTKGLFNRGRVILVDDIDAFAGNDDYGGVGAVLDAVSGSSVPIVLTSRAENENTKKFSKISKKLNLNSRSRAEVVGFLKEICNKEKIICESGVLNTIAARSEGDLRGCLNDLETLKTKPDVKFDDINDAGSREKDRDINYCLGEIFKEKSFDVSRTLEHIEKSPDECMLWISDNILNEYSGDELKKAYHYMSRADLFRARIMKNQYWRFMYYQCFFMTAGVSLSKKEANFENQKYSYPEKIRYLGMTKFSRAYANSVARKIAEKCHTSVKKAKEQYMPLLRELYSRNNLVEGIDLDDKEMNWLIG